MKTTYVDIDRNELAAMFAKRCFKVGVEIGVDQGKYAEVLCRANPGLKLYCVDPWKIYNQYADIKDPQDMEGRYQRAVKRLAPYNCVIIRESSMAAVKKFEPDSLDFVYIDGNHAYEYVLSDLKEWTKRVKPGGIVSGHDYTTRKHKYVGYAVSKAVDFYLESEGWIEEFFVCTKPIKSTWYFVKK